MIGRGVPAGAISPPQMPESKPGRPASAIVGRSGNSPARFAVAAASALTLPAAMCGAMVECRREHHGDASGNQVGRGLSAAAGVGHVRHLDVGQHLEQFAGQMRRAADADRTEEQLVRLDFASAISSRTLLTPSEGCTTRMLGTVATSAIGVSSLARSVDWLGEIAVLVAFETEARNSV